MRFSNLGTIVSRIGSFFGTAISWLYVGMMLFSGLCGLLAVPALIVYGIYLAVVPAHAQKGSGRASGGYSLPTYRVPSGSGEHYVNGYYHSNGTYVQPHYQTNPDGVFQNNWSTKGNVNPHTGVEGTKVTPPSGEESSVRVYRPSSTILQPTYRTYPSVPSFRNYHPMPLAIVPPSVPVVRSYHPTPLVSAPLSVPIVTPSEVTPKDVSSNYSSLDEQMRASAASRLRTKGEAVDWHKYNLGELLDMESRLGTSKRLKTMGIDVDWKTTPLSDMLDQESRAGTARRLGSMGIEVDWRTMSLSQMLDWESRASTAQRLKRRGVSVRWQDHSLSDLLSMEMSSSR